MAGLTPLEKTMIQEIYKGYIEQKPYIDGLNLVVFGHEKSGILGLVQDNIQNKKDIRQYKNDRVIVISISAIITALGAWVAKLIS